MAFIFMHCYNLYGKLQSLCIASIATISTRYFNLEAKSLSFILLLGSSVLPFLASSTFLLLRSLHLFFTSSLAWFEPLIKGSWDERNYQQSDNFVLLLFNFESAVDHKISFILFLHSTSLFIPSIIIWLNPGHIFVNFSFYQTFLQKTCIFQQDLTSGCRSRRQPYWPQDRLQCPPYFFYHFDPSNVLHLKSIFLHILSLSLLPPFCVCCYPFVSTTMAVF